MDDLLDVLEMLLHTSYTIGAVVLSNWQPVGAGILMVMQGVYLFYKIKQKRKECK